jgi:hypothetical protein
VFPAVLESPLDANDDLKLVAGTHWGVSFDEDGGVRRPQHCDTCELPHRACMTDTVAGTRLNVPLRA